MVFTVFYKPPGIVKDMLTGASSAMSCHPPLIAHIGSKGNDCVADTCDALAKRQGTVRKEVKSSCHVMNNADSLQKVMTKGQASTKSRNGNIK